MKLITVEELEVKGIFLSQGGIDSINKLIESKLKHSYVSDPLNTGFRECTIKEGCDTDSTHFIYHTTVPILEAKVECDHQFTVQWNGWIADMSFCPKCGEKLS